MTTPPPLSPKSRLPPVYRVPDDDAQGRKGAVLYQLEDEGDPVLRLRATVREVHDDGATRFLYRVEAFSRLTGHRLGAAEQVTALGSEEEFAARAREFQTEPFRRVMDQLSAQLRDAYSAEEAGVDLPA
ncbi:MAG: hypothetical protein NVSMB17_03610 [Candidatus Dormibacteria bacterium]